MPETPNHGCWCCPPGMQIAVSRNSLACGKDGVQNKVGFTLHAGGAGCQKAMPSGYHPLTLPPSPRVTLCHHASVSVWAGHRHAQGGFHRFSEAQVPLLVRESNYQNGENYDCPDGGQ